MPELLLKGLVNARTAGEHTCKAALKVKKRVRADT